MVWKLLEAFTNVRTQQKLFADDSIDKLNRSITVSFLIIVTLFVGTKNLVSEQVKCNGELLEFSFKSDYVNTICSVKDIIALVKPGKSYDDSTKGFSFYPWIPLITLLLAFCYYAPYLIWKYMTRENMYQHMPIDINGVVGILSKSNLLDESKFNENIECASKYLDKCFSINNYEDGYNDEFEPQQNGKQTQDMDELILKNYSMNKRPRSFQNKSNFFYVPLIFKYIFIKFVYFGVSVSIFTLIDFLFQFRTTFHLFGYELYKDLTNKTIGDDFDYLQSVYFPRVVKCIVHGIDDVKNMRTHEYICALPINYFNEKIFLFLWFWFILIAVLNLFSLIKWIFMFIFRRQIIKSMLLWPFRYNYNIDKYIYMFVNDYLSTEGFLVLMLIRSNTQDWHCRVILRNLWKLFMNRLKEDSELFKYDTDALKSFHYGNLDQSQSEQYSAGLNQTVEAAGRRRLDMNEDKANNTPVSILKTNSIYEKNSTKECKNNYKQRDVLFKIPKSDHDFV